MFFSLVLLEQAKRLVVEAVTERMRALQADNERLRANEKRAIEALLKSAYPWRDGDSIAAGIEANSAGWKLTEIRERNLRDENGRLRAALDLIRRGLSNPADIAADALDTTQKGRG